MPIKYTDPSRELVRKNVENFREQLSPITIKGGRAAFRYGFHRLSNSLSTLKTTGLNYNIENLIVSRKRFMEIQTRPSDWTQMVSFHEIRNLRSSASHSNLEGIASDTEHILRGTDDLLIYTTLHTF